MVAVVMVLFAGCSRKSECNLSNLRIRSVELDGSDSAYIADALKAELYSRGARYDPSGGVVKGIIYSNENGVPYAVSIEVQSTSYAGTATATEQPADPPFHGKAPDGSAERRIAVVAAVDLCRCAQETDRKP